MIRNILVLLSTILLMLVISGCDNPGQSSASTSESASESQSAIAEEPSSRAEDTSGEEAIPEPEPAPSFEWQVDTPEPHDMDSELLALLHTALVGTDIYSMVTIKDGCLIDEYYKEGCDEATVFTIHSCSKSFTGALIGIALEEGYIESIDLSIAEYFPQLSDTDKEAITIRHLLTHTSGLEWHEWGGDSSSWRPFRDAENWVDYILDSSLVATPGTTFNYTTGGTHLLSAILEKATGKPSMEYAKEHIFDMIGMDSVEWGKDPQGIADGGNGLAMTARDAAKFGWLFLQGGMWDGRQLVPADWVEESTSIQSVGAGGRSGAYGYQWWVRPFEGYDAYYAMGARGQFIFIVPELELVTVVNSRGSDTYAPMTYFTDYILAAYRAPQES